MMLSQHYQTYKTVPAEHWPLPQLGQRVAYHSKVSGVPLPAIVTCTQASYDPEAGRRGDLAPPTSIMHLHLKVLSPGPGSPYDEFDIPPGYGKGEWAPLEGAF
jgi:hypothetical protein